MGKNSKSDAFVNLIAPLTTLATDIVMPPRHSAAPRNSAATRHSAAPRHSAATSSWSELVNEALETEILPRLVAKQRARSSKLQFLPDCSNSVTAAAVAGFVALIIAEDMEQARAIADRVILQTGSREALMDLLLTPSAQLLGQMWESDTADFVTVTLCVYRLDQIMKESSAAGQVDKLANAHECRILLLPVPGEQHGFGLGMIADAFREGGWCVRSGPAVARSKLLDLVRDEWFDVIGFSVSSERWLKGLASCIRAVRTASCNADVFVMAGGQAIAGQPERTRFLGIDATARSGQDAFAQANNFMERTVTAGLRQSNVRLTEFG